TNRDSEIKLLWKRLSRDKEYFVPLYEKFLQEYEDLGHEGNHDGSGVALCHTMVFIAPKAP
ncbi:hypothetical protein TNCV_4060561, partial [Trichonephila clavipes]